jgi:hypothetical protein
MSCFIYFCNQGLVSKGHDQGFRGAGVVDVFTDTVLYSEVHGSEDTETLHLESSEMDLMGQNILEVVV